MVADPGLGPLLNPFDTFGRGGEFGSGVGGLGSGIEVKDEDACNGDGEGDNDNAGGVGSDVFSVFRATSW